MKNNTNNTNDIERTYFSSNALFIMEIIKGRFSLSLYVGRITEYFFPVAAIFWLKTTTCFRVPEICNYSTVHKPFLTD